MNRWLLGVYCLLALVPGGMLSQTEKPSGSPPQFEVASIRPSKDSSRWRAEFTSDGLTAENTPLAYILQMAYGFEPQQQWALGPDWIYSSRFTIQARVDQEAIPHPVREQERVMLQQLLIDRFHLKLHHEQRKYPMYALVVGKHGPKLTASRPEEIQPMCHVLGSRHSSIQLQGCSMADLVDILSGSPSANLGRVMVDRTGLKGRYNLELQWRSANLAATAASQDSKPDLMTALQEQLGLKLVPKRGMLDTIVIDNIEMPTSN